MDVVIISNPVTDCNYLCRQRSSMPTSAPVTNPVSSYSWQRVPAESTIRSISRKSIPCIRWYRSSKMAVTVTVSVLLHRIPMVRCGHTKTLKDVHNIMSLKMIWFFSSPTIAVGPIKTKRLSILKFIDYYSILFMIMYSFVIGIEILSSHHFICRCIHISKIALFPKIKSISLVTFIILTF